MWSDFLCNDLSDETFSALALPAAAMPPSSGDCTFEEDMCGWSNPGPQQRVDNLQYLRVRASEFGFPTTDHSTGSRQGEGQVAGMDISKDSEHSLWYQFNFILAF